ncbi:DnaT-like ssDNA-binding domain-containing protein [Oceanobacter antarcticus]|uniref:DnaT-like ssDNA-binding domain-containing protein n=1 Tax=Oceanobacter antarcticus TaxID=3133425 RepID=A0ABW8NN15_9GAMM
MSSHPLFTDFSIPLSVTLAATIGLEDAVLLTIINQAAVLQHDSSRHGIRLARETVRQQLPFWDDVTIRRTLASLVDKGLVRLHGPMYPESIELVLSFDQSQSTVNASAQQGETSQAMGTGSIGRGSIGRGSIGTGSPSTSAIPTGHQGISNDWQPGADTLTRLQQHGIPTSFIWIQRDAFLLQGQEQGANRNDWNTRFFRFVKKQWVYAQNDAERQRLQQENQLNRSGFNVASDEAAPIGHQWRPSEDALQILQRSGIDQQFIDDAVAEFILYWRERGDALKTWNSKFIQHIRQQWARYSAAMEHSTVPLPIASDWQPSRDCYDILAMAHIDPQFARERVAEFVLYWRDSHQVHNSWNSRFLQYIKQQWARQLSQPTTQGGKNGQTTAEPDYTTVEASLRRLNDTSW